MLFDLVALASTATTADKAVVISTFNRVKSEGIPGEVTTAPGALKKK